MAKILCIDDDIDVLQSCQMILGSAGHEIDTAENGTLGLSKARTWQPDLIILDVMMTDDTEGFHVAYAIRQDEKLRYCPILMLTSINEKSGMKFDPEKDGEFLPVDQFISKPAAPAALQAAVTRLLSLPQDQINLEGRKQLV